MAAVGDGLAAEGAESAEWEPLDRGPGQAEARGRGRRSVAGMGEE